jgi:hypothetical protein
MQDRILRFLVGIYLVGLGGFLECGETVPANESHIKVWWLVMAIPMVIYAPWVMVRVMIKRSSKDKQTLKDPSA